MPAADDNRTASTLIRQWQMLQAIKRDLVKQGILNGDATPAQVLEALRKLVPSDLFAK